MTRQLRNLTVGLFMVLAWKAPAQTPPIMTYQGRLTSNSTNFSGTGYFKFALISKSPLVLGPRTHWSNDGSSTDANEPLAAVPVTVAEGLFVVPLGEAALPNMTPIPVDVFNHPVVLLRMWFSPEEDAPNYTLLSPDQRITTTGYAMMAATVQAQGIGSAQIAPGAVSGPHLADGSVTTAKLADQAVTREKLAPNSVGPNEIAAGTVSSSHLSSILKLRQLILETEDRQRRIDLSGAGEGGVLRMFSTDGTFMELLDNGDGGHLKLFEGAGGLGAALTTVEMGSLPTGGFANFYQDNGNIGVHVEGQNDNLAGGKLTVKDASGANTFVVVGAAGGDSGSELRMSNAAGQKTIELDADWEPGRGGRISLYKADGTASILFQADKNGAGRITADVLELNGADLSEGFDVLAPDIEPEPGMLVCIHPSDSGKLTLSSKAYDQTVAGIISGAGGVRAGLVMRQKDTLANGRYPVALTGRVYCQVDASLAPIRAGDLITTSDVAGVGMKAVDRDQARGAIIGKAMTSLPSGRGEVLVLVSLQ